LDAGLFWRRAGLPILTARDAIADFAAGRRALPLLPVLFDFNALTPQKLNRQMKLKVTRFQTLVKRHTKATRPRRSECYRAGLFRD
jgi:hypothetical protein